MNKVRFFAISLIVTVFCFAFNVNASQRRIVVGTNATYPPYQFINENGKIVGFDIDLITLILENKGYSVEIKDMDFDGLIPSLLAKNIDVIASSMASSQERKKRIMFSEPYVPEESGIGIYVKADNTDINSLGDLTGKIIGSEIGTWGMDNIVSKIKKPKKIVGFSGNEIIIALQTGKIDALVVATDGPDDFIRKNKDPSKTIKRVGETYKTPGVAFGLRKNEKQLMKDINEELERLKKEKEYNEIYKKYVN
jgi:polar amino acid transport system substrate-binding protein